MTEVIRVPDIGNGEGAVIEIFVKAGDRIEKDQSLLTLESDKASMEIPAPGAGIVKSLKVRLGDRLKEGDEILELETGQAAAPVTTAAAPAASASPVPAGPVAATAAVPGSLQQVRVPDIGSSGKAKVIEIFVQPGEHIDKDQSLLTLESDKASMEIPAPAAGIIDSIQVSLNDEIGTGDLILTLKAASAPAAAPAASPASPAATAGSVPAAATSPVQQEVRVPDIGSSGKAKVIEIFVQPGEHIDKDQSLLTLESDKASMEIPAPAAGTVERVAVQIGDEIGTGDLILLLGGQPAAPASPVPAQATATPAPAVPAVAATAAEADLRPAPTAKSEHPMPAGAPSRDGARVHAGPAVRKLARELGVELATVTATGPRGRILKEDVQAYVKAALQQPATAPAGPVGSGIPPVPAVDFSKYGETEEIPLTRLMQLGAANLHRSWLNVPHVTQFESADITELEAFRVAQKAVAEKAGVKLTVLPLLLKACARLLQEMPEFNSSLAPGGAALIRKKYVHIGFAVDTPEGLLVPVIRDVDRKGLLQLAAEAAELAEKARSKKLSPEAMQGGCFTISSLGHIGGTGFTPIVNAPEVAILGVSKATLQPVWDGQAFQPRLMLPLSLSYDHRVINGAAAARFTRRLADVLAELRSLLL